MPRLIAMNKFLTPLAIAAVSIVIVTGARAAEGGDLDCGSKYDHVTCNGGTIT
jgi:hypothetical protein